jgi:transmembrane sensor
MGNRESSNEIETEAVRWIWRLDREGQTPELTTALETWLAGDTRRRGAFLQAEAAWTMLNSARRRPGEVDIVNGRLEYSASQPKKAWSRRLLIAGGAAIAAGVAGIALMRLARNQYTTGMGEILILPLADGSTASINTQSKVDIELASDARIVNLAQGEAWFQVAKDPLRPFVVKAGRVRVRAVGTAFSVRRHIAGVSVLVTEGVVETWVEGAPAHGVKVSAGAKAMLSDQAVISTAAMPNGEAERALAWRAGKIDLSGETLAEAAAEFNRYNARKLIISDEQLAQQRFFGVFRTDDPGAFARAVHESLGAEVVENSPSAICISATAAECPKGM